MVTSNISILNTLPVRAKVINNRSPILLPLQGVGTCALVPRALPWAVNWLPFQGARGDTDSQARAIAQRVQSPIVSGQARAEGPTSPEPRATPWVT